MYAPLQATHPPRSRVTHGAFAPRAPSPNSSFALAVCRRPLTGRPGDAGNRLRKGLSPRDDDGQDDGARNTGRHQREESRTTVTNTALPGETAAEPIDPAWWAAALADG